MFPFDEYTKYETSYYAGIILNILTEYNKKRINQPPSKDFISPDSNSHSRGDNMGDINFSYNTQQYSQNYIVNPHPLFMENPEAYLRTLTPTEKNILRVVMGMRKYTRLRFRNEWIAQKVNCSVRTVIRATNKFFGDGLLIKWQMDGNKYAPNDYVLSKYLIKGKRSFRVWLNLLPAMLQMLFCAHQIIPSQREYRANVTQSINISQRDSLYNNPCIRSKAYKGNKRTHYMQGTRMLHEYTPQWTHLHAQIAQRYRLGMYDKLKLLVFHPEVLQIIHGIDGLRNTFATFLQRCKSYSKEHGYLMRWKLFYNLCKKNGITPVAKREVIPHPTTNPTTGRKKIYEPIPVYGDKSVEELYADISKLEQELLRMKENGIADYLLEMGKKSIFNMKQEISDRLTRGCVA